MAAFRAALEERTRDRVPLDWAGTWGSLGWTLVLIADRTGDMARAREGLAMTEEAQAVLTDGGHEAWAEVVAGWINYARAVVDRLGGAAQR